MADNIEEREEKEMLKLNMFGMVCLHLHKLRIKISESAIKLDVEAWMGLIYELFRNTTPFLKRENLVEEMKKELNKIWDYYYANLEDPHMRDTRRIRTINALSDFQIKLYMEMDKVGLYAPKIKYRFGVQALKEKFGLEEEDG